MIFCRFSSRPSPHFAPRSRLEALSLRISKTSSTCSSFFLNSSEVRTPLVTSSIKPVSPGLSSKAAFIREPAAVRASAYSSSLLLAFSKALSCSGPMPSFMAAPVSSAAVLALFRASVTWLMASALSPAPWAASLVLLMASAVWSAPEVSAVVLILMFSSLFDISFIYRLLKFKRASHKACMTSQREDWGMWGGRGLPTLTTS